MKHKTARFLDKHAVPNWRKGFKFQTTWWHVAGLLFAGLGTGLALVYGSADQFQHSLLKDWQTYSIFFIIFSGSIIARFLK